MTFTALKNDKLKISLNGDETLRFFGGADSIDQNDPTIRLAIKLLFKKALLNCNFRPSGGSMFVEVVKTALGGCDIYFTKSRKETCSAKADDFAVIEFSEIPDVIRAAKVIKEGCSITKSRFFRVKNKYRLAIWYEQSSCTSLLYEFADTIFRTSLCIAEAEEYGKELIKENAVEILAKL